MVELALTAPMLILMIIAMAEVGFAANNFLILGDVVRSAGRIAVNLSVTDWPYNQARNYNRLDCDDSQVAGTELSYHLFGNNTTVEDFRTEKRGLSLPGMFDDVEKPKGIFDEVACAVTNGLNPLVFNDHSPTTNTTAKDDIVISVVNYRRMSNDNPEDAIGPNNPSHPLYQRMSGQYGGAWVRVTGRWPLENRYCSTGPGLGDERDPFDFKRFTLSNAWTDGIKDTNEGDGGVVNANGIVTTSQQIRGYVFTGLSRAPDGCIGSTFTVQEIEERLNITGSVFNPKAANGGIIIIEVYWQHHPAVFGPIFQGFTGNRADDPVLHMWAWFPVPNAEPTPTPKP